MAFVDNLNYKIFRTPDLNDGSDNLCIIVREDDGDIKINIPMQLFDEISVMRYAQLLQTKQAVPTMKAALQKYMDQIGCDSLCRYRGRATIEERKHNEEKRIYREKKRLIKDVLEKQLLEELDKQGLNEDGSKKEQLDEKPKEQENKVQEEVKKEGE